MRFTFTTKWMRRRKATAAVLSELPRDRFAAVPLMAENVTVQDPGPPGNILLARKLEAKGRLSALLASWFRYDYSVRLQLDERGSFFWRQIDGRRTLEQIAEALRNQYRLTDAGAREGTILFVKELMTRNFISLKIERSRARDQARTGW